MHTGALNDILFILLLFFLIVSTIANPNIIRVNNPKGKGDSKSKQTIVVSIDKDNKMYLGNKEIFEYSLDSLLKEEVTRVRQFVDTPAVVINADTVSYTGSFFKIMAAAKRVGAKVVANVKP